MLIKKAKAGLLKEMFFFFLSEKSHALLFEFLVSYLHHCVLQSQPCMHTIPVFAIAVNYVGGSGEGIGAVTCSDVMVSGCGDFCFG